MSDFPNASAVEFLKRVSDGHWHLFAPDDEPRSVVDAADLLTENKALVCRAHLDIVERKTKQIIRLHILHNGPWDNLQAWMQTQVRLAAESVGWFVNGKPAFPLAIAHHEKAHQITRYGESLLACEIDAEPGKIVCGLEKDEFIGFDSPEPVSMEMAKTDYEQPAWVDHLLQSIGTSDSQVGAKITSRVPCKIEERPGGKSHEALMQAVHKCRSEGTSVRETPSAVSAEGFCEHPHSTLDGWYRNWKEKNVQ
jgi:hypothetical protein